MMNPKNMPWYGKHEERPSTATIQAGTLLRQNGVILLVETIEVIIGYEHPVHLASVYNTETNEKKLVPIIGLNSDFIAGEIEVVR